MLFEYERLRCCDGTKCQRYRWYVNLARAKSHAYSDWRSLTHLSICVLNLGLWYLIEWTEHLSNPCLTDWQETPLATMTSSLNLMDSSRST